MYLAIFNLFATLFFAAALSVTVRLLVESERKRKALQKKANESSSSMVMCCSSSSSSDDIDDKIDVEQYRYPRVTLPPKAKLRPTTRALSTATPAKADFYVQVQDRTELCLKTSIAVSFEGTEIVVVGNSSAPNDSSKPELKTTTKLNDADFAVRLNQGTCVTVSSDRDNVGLIKRLEAEQDFNIMPGSLITVPAGCEVYFRNDVSRTKFLTKETMVCTLLPPLGDTDEETTKIATRSEN